MRRDRVVVGVIEPVKYTHEHKARQTSDEVTYDEHWKEDGILYKNYLPINDFRSFSSIEGSQ